MTSQRWLVLVAFVVGLPLVGYAVGGLRGGVPELRFASVVAFLLGAGILLAVVLAAAYARRNRAALAAIFAPGMKATLVALFVLILLDAAILVYSIFLIEAMAIGRVHIVFLAFVAIGALAGAIAMMKAGLFISKRVSTVVVGRVAAASEQPELIRFVQRVADRMGAKRPDSMVLGLEPTFYATSGEVRTLPECRTSAGQTLYLSLPLMRTLTKPELAAVIGHELGHFTGDDTRYSLQFYPVYAGTTRALEALNDNTGDASRSLALLPAVAILSFFLDRFAVAEREIGRERELAADRAGASASSAHDLAASLVKIGALAPLWNEVRGAMVGALNEGKAYSNVSTLFAAHAADRAPNADVGAVLDARATHPTDTHPSTYARIVTLGLDPRDIASSALTIDTNSSAIELVERAEEIELELTSIEHDLLLARGIARLPQTDGGDTYQGDQRGLAAGAHA